RSAVRAPPVAPVPVPAAAAARSGAGRRAVPGRLAETDRRARGLDAGGRIRDVAVPHRPQPVDRPLAGAAPPAARAGRCRRAHRPGARSGHAGTAAVGIRAAAQAAACAGRTAARAARGDRAAAGAGTEPGRDRRDHRRGPGDGEIAPALRDGQAAGAAGDGAAMSRHAHEALTPEERDIAQRLARLESAAAPSPGLDARILAAARAGAEAPPARAVAPARSRRPRWPLGMGVAASLVVAVGVAWQLRPHPDSVALDAPSEVALSRTRAEPAATAAATDAPAAAASAAKEAVAPPADAAPASIAMPLPAATAAGAAPGSVERERSEAAAQLAREAARQL